MESAAHGITIALLSIYNRPEKHHARVVLHYSALIRRRDCPINLEISTSGSQT
jgi:hypothetical protein